MMNLKVGEIALIAILIGFGGASFYFINKHDRLEVGMKNLTEKLNRVEKSFSELQSENLYAAENAKQASALSNTPVQNSSPAQPATVIRQVTNNSSEKSYFFRFRSPKILEMRRKKNQQGLVTLKSGKKTIKVRVPRVLQAGLDRVGPGGVSGNVVRNRGYYVFVVAQPGQEPKLLLQAEGEKGKPLDSTFFKSVALWYIFVNQNLEVVPFRDVGGGLNLYFTKNSSEPLKVQAPSGSGSVIVDLTRMASAAVPRFATTLLYRLNAVFGPKQTPLARVGLIYGGGAIDNLPYGGPSLYSAANLESENYVSQDGEIPFNKARNFKLAAQFQNLNQDPTSLEKSEVSIVVTGWRSR